MTRALDHIVWPTHDLEALADCFRRLGFTVGRRNRHPWGTENHIVQCDGVFLELLGFAADYQPVPVDAPSYPFAGFCADFLHGADAGAAMLVLRSRDAAGDADRLRGAGLGEGRLLPFARAAQGPDGSDRTVAFTIAFAALPGLPEIGAFLCEQHRPENFWNPAAQRHGNGAVGIAGVTILGPAPDSHAHWLRVFAERDEGPEGPVVILGDGSRLTVASSAHDHRASITAVDVSVADLAAHQDALRAEGFETTSAGSSVTVQAMALGHTALVFRQRGA